MRAGVMMAKVSWNAQNTLIGMVAAKSARGAAPTPCIRPPSCAGLPRTPLLPGGDSPKAMPKLQQECTQGSTWGGVVSGECNQERFIRRPTGGIVAVPTSTVRGAVQRSLGSARAWQVNASRPVVQIAHARVADTMNAP